MIYETVIGLEVHVELSTKTKLFCGCENRFGAEPNTLVCPVCLGLPGSLPVINKEALDRHILTAISLKCQIPSYSKFDRKNYFYPDMPKDYQISQYDLPLSSGGSIEIIDESGETKKIRINRIHLEEDTGKSIHGGEARNIAQSDFTLLNYNRAGVPLLEIVSEPDMKSPEEAYRYLVNLKKILNWLRVSDCKMEEGSLRCDANISLREKGATVLGTKTEIKNMNSFKGVKSALTFEEERQKKILESGGEVLQETRGWDADKGVTIPMRGKEEAHDYRYFPEPDLPPIIPGEGWLRNIEEKLPEMPRQRKERFISQYNLPTYDAEILTSYIDFADFFEKAASLCNNPKQVSNWMMGDISKYLNTNGLEIRETKLAPEALGEMIKMIDDEIISGKIGKNVVEELLEKGGSPGEIVETKGWKQITSREELLPHINRAFEENPQVVEDYLAGKESALQFMVGQIMKSTRGKGSPGAINRLIQEKMSRRD